MLDNSQSEHFSSSFRNDFSFGDRHKPWTPNDFDISSQLGKGLYGTVFNVLEKKSQKILALKMVAKRDVIQNNDVKSLKTEIEIHSRLYHPNIIRMYGYFYDNNNVYMVTEKACYGSLYDLVKNGTKFNETTIVDIIFQVCQALQYLKKAHIIHHDLKLENILVTKVDNLSLVDTSLRKYEVKLSDFGCAMQCFGKIKNLVNIKANYNLDGLQGTPMYFAPEMCKKEPYDFGIDVWSVGVLAYELLCGQSPFYSCYPNQIIKKISNYLFPQTFNLEITKNGGSSAFIEMIKNFLERDPKKRIKIEDIHKLKIFKPYYTKDTINSKS